MAERQRGVHVPEEAGEDLDRKPDHKRRVPEAGPNLDTTRPQFQIRRKQGPNLDLKKAERTPLGSDQRAA